MEQTLLETPSCSLTFEHRLSYLYAYASGKRDKKFTCKQIWKQILKESKSNRYRKILFERKIEGVGTVSELRNTITELSSLIDGEYIAFIDQTPEHFQTNKLAEISASNLGINIKFCRTIGEAKEWLLLK